MLSTVGGTFQRTFYEAAAIWATNVKNGWELGEPSEESFLKQQQQPFGSTTMDLPQRTIESRNVILPRNLYYGWRLKTPKLLLLGDKNLVIAKPQDPPCHQPKPQPQLTKTPRIQHRFHKLSCCAARMVHAMVNNADRCPPAHIHTFKQWMTEWQTSK